MNEMLFAVPLLLSTSIVLRDPTFPLERRREVLRRLLPMRGDERPIRVEIHVDAPARWRRALKRVVVRCLTIRSAAKDERDVGRLAAGAGAAEGGHPDAPGWELAEGLPSRERELVTAHFEEVGELAGAVAKGW